jgi:AraC-like DNA-binding protein
LLGTKRCSLDELAAALGVHPRTLNRRLKASDTSFREIYEGARHHLAMQLLRDTRSSIQNIALVLNYSGSNAFGRAFTQWEGVPPATWRRRMWADIDLGAGRR